MMKIDGSSNWMLLLCVLICILGALLMRVFIEKPALKLRNKILSYPRFDILSLKKKSVG